MVFTSCFVLRDCVPGISQCPDCDRVGHGFVDKRLAQIIETYISLEDSLGHAVLSSQTLEENPSSGHLSIYAHLLSRSHIIAILCGRTT